MVDLVTVVSVAGGIVSLYFMFYKPMEKNSVTRTKQTMCIEKNTESLDRLQKTLEKYEEKNSKSHERLWQHNEKQDDILSKHELRIKVIEREVGIEDGERN